METIRVSIVLCTYNGEHYLAQQLDTLLRQTYPIHEIIVQDDHSTDNTVGILEDYAVRYSCIKLFRNERHGGINANFFSAMRRAEGDVIAISDQDDLWEPTKIERQIAFLGDHLLCACRSMPFADDGAPVGYDSRRPDVHLIRLLYSSIPGHTMLFRRRLLDMLPKPDDSLRTYYDVYLGLTAAANDGLVLLDEVLVHQRRHANAATYAVVDTRRRPSAANGLYILFYSLWNFRRVHPYQCAYFQRRLRLMQGIHAVTGSAASLCEEGRLFDEALRIVRLQSQEGILPFLQLFRLHIRHRHHLFYTEGHGFLNFCRAALYPIMQTYNYRYLANP